MQHTQKTEKVGMIILPSILGSKSSSVTEDPQIQRTRKILLIILGVCFVFSVLSTITVISGTAVPNRMQEAQRGAQIGQCITSVLLYGLGL
ncbi:unnamed protein product [Rotaria sordida]|uniref:Uncharacterized protein n=1 Tax=Rotaria sordida TaxID=392033 RepID=A0A815Z9S4_9BILA|nr:unnamed protein product [Rotaria sordida]CAF1582139.1 unnamed protein product [Rotaria sordida]